MTSITNEPNPMVVANPLANFEKQGMIKVIAPAKVNLFLGVGALREDGFHEVNTVMHALNIHDVLHFDYRVEDSEGLQIELSCFAREGLEALDIDSESNLATQAIRRLAEKLGRNVDETISVRIEKHIPHQAGLGGGSADAAAALVGAAQLWGIDKMSPAVLETASEIGSDVGFFLHGACAYFTGRGEQFSHLLKPMSRAIVLVKPERGVPTPAAYQAFDAIPLPVSDELLSCAMNATEAAEVPLLNNLFEAAESILPELTTMRQWLKEKEGVEEVLLSGSGSAMFAICENFGAACAISADAQANGWWARATTFGSLGATAVPTKE